MHAKCINVIGVERSGTNWLEVLLRDNLKCDVWAHKKHEPRPSLNKALDKAHDRLLSGFSMDDIGYVAIIKNPWAWAVSFRKTRMTVKPRFNITGKQIKNSTRECICHYWNDNNESYIKMAKQHPDRFMVVTYDDMVKDWKPVIKKIASHFNIASSTATAIGRVVGPNRKICNHKFNPDFYLKHQYLRGLKPDEIQWIRANASKLVMNYCGFSVPRSLPQGVSRRKTRSTRRVGGA